MCQLHANCKDYNLIKVSIRSYLLKGNAQADHQSQYKQGEGVVGFSTIPRCYDAHDTLLYMRLSFWFLSFFHSSSGIVQATMAMVNFCDNCLKKKEEGQLSRVINSHALGNSYLKRLRPSALKSYIVISTHC